MLENKKLIEKEKISAVIITLNEERNIARCLQSLQGVADEIIVVDSGSTDRTEEICKTFGVKFIYQKWMGDGPQKNFAVSQTTHKWALTIDADEVVSPKLADEIRALFAQDEEPLFAGYNIPFRLNFLKKNFKHGTEARQMHLRLYDKTRGEFTPVIAHTKRLVTGPVGTLKHEILHYSFFDIEHLLRKSNDYTTITAHSRFKAKKRPHKAWTGIDLVVRFFIYYFIRRNFLNGYPGFVWSVLSAYYSFVRNCKLIELQRTLPALMYHNITLNHSDCVDIRLETLEKQFADIKQKGYTPIWFKELLTYPATPLPDKPILITFDDGYQSNADYLFPLLEKYDFKASIALVPKYIGESSAWDEHPIPLMDADTLKSAPSHRIEYLIHSYAHINYRHSEPAAVEEDVQKAAHTLKTLGIDYTPVMVYPFGGFPRKKDEYRKFCEILKRNGIELGVRIGNRINKLPLNDRFHICRIDVTRKMKTNKWCKAI
ncbi:hypothetical protein AGMMS4956_05290 [Bacteroidia bacterium]|nr:hypothetical protein AGMMS4956_05290 [Bacteroidia bacterium]